LRLGDSKIANDYYLLKKNDVIKIGNDYILRVERSDFKVPAKCSSCEENPIGSLNLNCGHLQYCDECQKKEPKICWKCHCEIKNKKRLII